MHARYRVESSYINYRFSDLINELKHSQSVTSMKSKFIEFI